MHLTIKQLYHQGSVWQTRNIAAIGEALNGEISWTVTARRHVDHALLLPVHVNYTFPLWWFQTLSLFSGCRSHQPVCGENGRDYRDECEAQRAGVRVKCNYECYHCRSTRWSRRRPYDSVMISAADDVPDGKEHNKRADDDVSDEKEHKSRSKESKKERKSKKSRSKKSPK